MSKANCEITVVGAGVAGLTTALALSERGAKVSVIERSLVLGQKSCSRFAGGMLAPWCEGASAEPLVVTLGRESLSYWPRVHSATVQRGSLVVALHRDAPELDRFARRSTEHRMVDGAELAGLEPDLANRFPRALFFAEEAHLDPRAALVSLATQLSTRGVKIRFGVDVEALPASVRRVDCRGLAARDRQPDLRGVKGEMLLVRCDGVRLSRPLRLLHPRFPLYIVPRGDGLFMIGATMVESDASGFVTARAMVELLNASFMMHPAFAEAEIVEIGSDARPAFRDNLPKLRRDGANLSVNGLYRHGFLLSPALARMAAAAMLDGAEFPEVT